MNKNKALPWIIWSLAAGAFFLSYIVRIAPSTMIATLMEDFQVSSEGIGTLGAYFFYSYVAMQVPVGAVVDRYGVRAALSMAIALCAITTYVFAAAEVFWLAQISRFFFGFAMSFAFISAIKLASTWFSPQRFSMLVGATQALGMLGGALSMTVMGRCISAYGWRPSLLVFALILGILAVGIAIIVRNKPTNLTNSTTKQSHIKIIPALKETLSNAQTWILASFVGLVFVPTTVFELWGSFFLETVHGISHQDAHDALSIIFISQAIGGPIAGVLANKFGRRKIIIATALSGIIILPWIIFGKNLPYQVIALLLAIYGLTASGMVAAYTAAVETVSKQLSGIALGFNNAMSVGVGAIFMQVIGLVIHLLYLNNNGNTDNIAYGVAEVKPAMALTIVTVLIALILSIFVKETLNKQTNH